ncbi:MAG TPA: TPM domain-containing protein [Spirochaetota bacterium]|nr:TPM domain-containing protein [Spirochaetota bacterium]
MRRFIYAALLLLGAAPALFARDVPALSGRVNDTAGMISPQVSADLEKRLADFESSDSTQVVILTVDSLDGEPIEDFGIKVAEAWKIGQAKKDNGVIFLVSKNDRRMRIEVGRGLEGVLTDLLAGRIIDNVVAPRFKQGDYDAGFAEGTKAIIEACRGEFKNDGAVRAAAETPLSGETALIFAAVLAVVIIILSAWTRIGGGLLGAVGLPLIVNFSMIPLPLIGIVIAGVIGFILGLIIPLLPFSGGRGGYFGGGGGSSSSSGGSFSGGGGSFGGGGSSGGW